MYTIYSKPGCASCVAAKTTLEARGEGVDYKVLGKDYDLNEFVQVAPEGFRSFPLILKDGEVVGTYADLQKTFGG